MHKVKIAKREARFHDYTYYVWEGCPTPRCAQSNTNWYSDINLGGTCTGCQGRLPGAALYKRLQSRKNYHVGLKP